MKKFLSVWLVCLLLVFSCSSLFLFFKKNNNAENKNNQSGVDWSNITISCLGDSITLGEQLDNPYPKILQKQLGVKFCYNYGIGWSTCSVLENGCDCHSDNKNYTHYPMCERYTQIKQNSDIIIVMCGFNDAGLAPLGTIDSTDTTTFYGAMNAMCKGLKEKYKDSWIFFMTSFKYDHYSVENPVNDFGAHREDYYHTAVVDVCSKYSIDVFDTFTEINWHSAINAIDNVHPNQEFVTNTWVPAIVQYIKTNYK